MPIALIKLTNVSVHSDYGGVSHALSRQILKLQNLSKPALATPQDRYADS
jgi:hypothetical protein